MNPRPVLRYHGGKCKLAPWIISHFPPHRIYVEPYGGAASVLMQKPRAYTEVYNDLDGEIVNVFRVLRNPTTAHELARLIALTPFAREEFDQSYLPAPDSVEQARRTIFRSSAGYGSNAHNRTTGFRSNTTRSRTTPAHDWSNYPDHIASFCQRLRGVTIENRPALDIIRQYDSPMTLFYLDPPYSLGARDAGTDYRYEMTDDDHADLAQALHHIQGMAAISGYQCRPYDDLYHDWRRIERATYADGARPRREILWLSPNAHSQLPIEW